MKYYIDKSGKLYEKSGIDYLIENEIDVPDDLVVATTDQINAVLNPKPTDEQLNSQAKVTRDDAIESYKGTVEFDGSLFDSSGVSLNNINRAIRIAERDDLEETYLHSWRLADNSWRDTTLAELREVKKLIEQDLDRIFESVWLQFIEWDFGDKKSTFTFIENKR